SGETLLLLQNRDLAYTVPLRRKGKGANRRNACFALPVGTVTTVDWQTEDSRLPVQTRAAVARRPGDSKVQVYAFGGWKPGRELPLGRLLDWLAEVLQRKYPEKKVIELQRPLACPEGLEL